MGVTLDVNVERFVGEVSGRVVQGMDRACQFAAEQARALAPTRTKRMVGGIDYEVVARGDVVEGRVGGRRNVAFYQRFVELGTKKMAARPHLRPAVFNNGQTITRMINEGDGT